MQEVNRREQEIAEKKAALDDMKRKNQLVQDKVGKKTYFSQNKRNRSKVQEQIKTLTMKLEELRVEHETNEASGESIISCLNDKLSQVSDWR